MGTIARYILAVFSIIFVASSVYAGQLQSIKYVNGKSSDRDQVTIQGKILRYTDDEKCLLGDGTGKIILDFDDDKAMAQFNVGDKLQVSGEVDTHILGGKEIEVKAIKQLGKKTRLPGIKKGEKRGVAKRLESLQGLYENGLISEDEYQSKRKDILEDL